MFVNKIKFQRELADQEDEIVAMRREANQTNKSLDILGNDSIDFENFPAPNLRSSILPGFQPNSTADLLNESPDDLSFCQVIFH